MMSRIEIIRGDDVTLRMTFTDSNGDLINLTNCTVFLTVKRKLSDSDTSAVISKTVTSFDDPTSGIQDILLADTETNLAPGMYWYDVQLKDQNGFISSIAKDKFVIEQDVTLRTS